VGPTALNSLSLAATPDLAAVLASTPDPLAALRATTAPSGASLLAAPVTAPIATMPIQSLTALSTDAVVPQGITPSAALQPAAALQPSVASRPPATSTSQPAVMQMFSLVSKVCGNWEDSEGGLIVIKSGPACDVIITHETKGQQTIKYTDFVVSGKFRYDGRDGDLEGNIIKWNSGSVWTKDD
jgi:hypothetical protein